MLVEAGSEARKKVELDGLDQLLFKDYRLVCLFTDISKYLLKIFIGIRLLGYLS